jgi:hypothetical protein
MRCLLLSPKERIVRAFDAVDLADARQQMRDLCLQHKTTFLLAIITRRGVYSAPPTVPTVDDRAE